MGRGTRRAVVIAVVLAWMTSAAHAASAVDMQGHRLTLPRPATRIVSLAPFATELLFDAGAGHHVVGVSRYSNYPPAARRLPIVGDATRLDLERIAALQPDLVIAWGSGTPAAAIARLRALGIPVFVLDPRRLGDIAQALRDLGRLAATMPVADAAAASYERELASLRVHYARRSPVSVFVEIAAHPLLTLNDRHLVSGVVRVCGGRNVFAAAPTLVVNVGWEDVIRKDPDAVFIVSEDGDAARAAWGRFPMVRAVAKHHLFVLAPDTIVQQTPRVLQGARAMCRAIAQVRAQARSQEGDIGRHKVSG